MSDDSFEMPDMDDLMRQMEDAMEDVEDAMENIPQMDEIQNIMGSLSSLIDGLPEDMKDMSGALAGFGEQHEANMQNLAGEPDWEMQAKIHVGEKLQLAVQAALDVDNVIQAYESTQGGGFEALVGSVAADTGEDFDDETMGQIMGQLKKGRSVALIKNIEVLSCRIQGAPGNAAQELQLSPQANIPLTMDENGLGFELAPMLTIRNQWEHANLPTFTPMAAEIIVPIKKFNAGQAFKIKFEPTSQNDPMLVELSFKPIG